MASLLEALPPLANLSGITIFLVLLVLTLYILNTFLTPSHPPSIPLLRESPSSQYFSLKTRLAYYTSNLTLQQEAWHKHLKHGQPVIVPGLGFSSELIIPPSWIKWVHSLPENVVNSWEAFVSLDQPYYSLGHAKYLRDSYQGELVKKFDLERMAENVWDEIGVAFKRWVDEEGEPDVEGWKALDVETTVRMIIAQITSRFTVGLPLCRNDEYLRITCDIADALVVVAATGMALPPILMPVAGRLASLPVKSKLSKFRELTKPVYNTRVQQITSTTTTTKTEKVDTPYDHLQLILEYAQQNRPSEFTNLHDIANRLVVSNFGGIHQSAIHLGVMVLNLLDSNPEFNTIPALREEFKRVIYSDDSDPNHIKWTKAKVSNLTKTDSLGRETMRLHTFAGRSVFRKVLADDLRTPGPNPVILPKGTMFSVLSKGPHLDESIYPDPLKFDPFRFSRLRETPGSPPVSLVTASMDYLPFGHGKHACPGRFILDFELKMFFCYLLRNYDLEWPGEYAGKRPPNYYLTEACFPPKGARMRIRKREVPAF